MAYRENAEILKAGCLADGVYEIWFETKNIAKEAKAGQFISVYSNDGSRLLPRPISICRVEGSKLRIVYRVAGKGTAEFSQMKAGMKNTGYNSDAYNEGHRAGKDAMASREIAG